jgi:hypothetical protein
MILSRILRFIPIIGDVKENIKSKDGGVGQLDPSKLVNQAIRLSLFGLMMYLFTKGEIPLAQLLEFAK